MNDEKFTLTKVRFKHRKIQKVDCLQITVSQIFKKLKKKNTVSVISQQIFFKDILISFQMILKEDAKKVEVVMTGKKQVNHNCYIFSFEFPGQRIDFQIGTYFKLYAKVPTHEHPEGQIMRKKYTPINPCSQKDRIDALIKIYRPNVHPDYPNGGRFTPFLQAQEVGVKMMMEGPFGKFSYKPGGTVLIKGKEHKCKRLFTIAGGSGITPLFQSLMEIASMKNEPVEMIFLFANSTEEDIVLRKELQDKSDRIKIHYILSKPPQGWKGHKGRISHEILKSICPLDDPETVYMFCGPKPFNKTIFELFGQYYPHSTLFKF